MRDSLTAYKRPFWKSPLFALCAVGAAVVAVFAAVAVAVSGPSAPASAYASYGQYVGSSFNCYYVQSTAEVATDIALGYCPAHSVAVHVPLGWEESHWYIYDSDTYINRVIPVSSRSTYRSYTVNFGKTYSSSISGYSSNKSTFGYNAPKTVTTRGGGSLRGSCAESMTTIQLRGGTSSGSGSSSGSRGGGSLRGGSGSSGSKTTTRTGSGSHC